MQLNIGFSKSYSLKSWQGRLIALVLIAVFSWVLFIPNKPDSNNWYPLHRAAGNGELLYAKWLVNVRHFDVNIRNKLGITPLHVATQENNLKVIDWLLNSGADLYARDNEGRSVLTHAAWRGNQETIKHVLRLAQNLIESRDNDGLTPLLYICGLSHGKLENVQCLLEHGHANAFHCCNNKNTILHEAILSENFLIIEFIISSFPPLINQPGDYGATPLHRAVDIGHTETMQLLLKHGADANAKTNDGLTPTDCAHNDAVKILLKKYQETGTLLKKV